MQAGEYWSLRARRLDLRQRYVSTGPDLTPQSTHTLSAFFGVQ
jgi:hypothetical protein